MVFSFTSQHPPAAQPSMLMVISCFIMNLLKRTTITKMLCSAANKSLCLVYYRNVLMLSFLRIGAIVAENVNHEIFLILITKSGGTRAKYE